MPLRHGTNAASPLLLFRRLSLNGCVRSLHSHRLLQLRTVNASPQKDDDHKPISPADALTKTLSGISQTSGRVAQTRNFILSPDNSEETWRALDEQVNTYPGYRSFKAIGVRGDGFVRAMVSAVESVVATPVHEECVQERPSSKGSYISVTVGPVLLHNREQVVQIYAAMKEDERLKWYM